ncbi:MAG: DUF4382 domain-containing protein [Candidatus Manganitrophus sp.]|nr:DUF4382 domain-containing protein [Candidatus Manganitrophus sp.]MDC4227119.1 DUF4382 domain-containing protein [Candidatus Manganitrophus sp.]WDT71746.1 MAG: DUF4382 domain-containing protein [Candidatus Manganitrophus sp.]WDT80883.1 MAG: DUF4382 domain-containing protein [Candidatus Manganitrophus sp.]
MKHPNMRSSARIGFFIFLIGVFFLFSACGGGGGGSDGGAGAGPGPGNGPVPGGNPPARAALFITDNLSDAFRQVLVTIYQVEFVEVGGGTQTAFSDDQGVTYDLRRLSGVLSPLSEGGVPAGRYSAVRITVAEGLILVDPAGQSFQPNFAQKDTTTCSAGRCVMTIAGEFEVAAENQVVLDFDLTQFTFDQQANTVTAEVVVDPDGSDHENYAEEEEGDFELKGVVQEVRLNGFDLAIFQARSFTPPNYTVSVTVDAATLYGCDGDDGLTECAIASLDDITTGRVVELEGSWNGEAFTATEVKVDADGDINTDRLDCSTVPTRSHADFMPTGWSSLSAEGYTFDPETFSITVGEKTILIVRETFIRLRTEEADQVICAEAIPAGPGKVSIQFNEATDRQGNAVSVASQILFGEDDTSEWWDWETIPENGEIPDGSEFGGGFGGVSVFQTEFEAISIPVP